jgi:hypothetical protein
MVKNPTNKDKILVAYNAYVGLLEKRRKGIKSQEIIGEWYDSTAPYQSPMKYVLAILMYAIASPLI